MQLREIIDLVECDILCGEMHLEQKFDYAFGSDLMSDVLAYVEDETILLTGLTNAQVIRTAEMLDLRTIVFVRGKNPAEDVIELARENDIVLLTTKHTMYNVAGVLYANGLKGLEV